MGQSTGALRAQIEEIMSDGRWRTAGEVSRKMLGQGVVAGEYVCKCILDEILEDGGMTSDVADHTKMWAKSEDRVGNGIRAIVLRVADSHGLTLSDLSGISRSTTINKARQEAMATAYKAGFSQVEIGRVVNRTSATVCHGITRHYARIGASAPPPEDMTRRTAK